MGERLRAFAHRFVPGHFQDPVGLALRLIRGRDPDALAAMRYAALGALLTPVDLLLQLGEKRRLNGAARPRLPVLLVCGPPRSGTTLVNQTLVTALPVATFTNLTALFPRSPLTANALFGRRLTAWQAAYQSYYGRLRGLAAPNDGLPLWDRWLSPDRTVPRERLTTEECEAMAAFFGALEALTGRPCITKNNNLNCQAAAVGDALPTAVFLCLEREPVALAQSLLRARLDIHGSLGQPYGISGPERNPEDPVSDVCHQVLYHERMSRVQREKLGPLRFRYLSYEAFCADPRAVVTEVAGWLGIAPDPARLAGVPERFAASSRNSGGVVPDQALRETLERLRYSPEGAARERSPAQGESR